MSAGIEGIKSGEGVFCVGATRRSMDAKTERRRRDIDTSIVHNVSAQNGTNNEDDLSPIAAIAKSRRFSPRELRNVKFSKDIQPSFTKAKRRKVLFKHVEIREMFIQIGESTVPGDGGPPLGLSPKMKRTVTHELDCFELERETGRRLKKSVGSPMHQRLGKERFAREGRLPANVRREMLARARARKGSIEAAEESAQRIQRDRCDSNRELEIMEPIDHQRSFTDSQIRQNDLWSHEKINEEIDKELHLDRFVGVGDLF